MEYVVIYCVLYDNIRYEIINTSTRRNRTVYVK